MPKSSERTYTQLGQRRVTNKITLSDYKVSQIAVVPVGSTQGWVETIAFPLEGTAPQIRFPDDIDIEHAARFIEISSRKTLTDKAKTFAGELQVWAAQWAEFKEAHCA